MAAETRTMPFTCMQKLIFVQSETHIWTKPEAVMSQLASKMFKGWTEVSDWLEHGVPHLKPKQDRVE